MFSSLKPFGPWLVASAVIHGLVLAALLTEPQPASDSTDQVLSGAETVSIEILPEQPVANPEEQLARVSRQTAASKITAQPPQPIIRAEAQKNPPVASQQTRPAVTRSLAQPYVQSQPIAQLSVGESSTSAAEPVPVAVRQAASQPDESKENERKLVRRHLKAFKFYPGSARRRGIEGHVDVAFTLAQNGAAIEVAVLHGSGHAVLDQAAVKTVYRAQPFPVHAGEFQFRLRFKRL